MYLKCLIKKKANQNVIKPAKETVFIDILSFIVKKDSGKKRMALALLFLNKQIKQ